MTTSRKKVNHQAGQLGNVISEPICAISMTVPAVVCSDASTTSWNAILTSLATYSLQISSLPRQRAPHSLVPAGHEPQQTGPTPDALWSHFG